MLEFWLLDQVLWSAIVIFLYDERTWNVDFVGIVEHKCYEEETSIMKSGNIPNSYHLETLPSKLQNRFQWLLKSFLTIIIINLRSLISF